MFAEIISTISNLLYSYILIVLLLGAGIYFSIRTRFVQFRMFVESLRVVAQPGNDKNGLSSFQALMVSTASRVGTGNIAGISTAICLGGAGAVFWMWLTAHPGKRLCFYREHPGPDLQTPGRRRQLLRRPCLLYPGGA